MRKRTMTEAAIRLALNDPEAYAASVLERHIHRLEVDRAELDIGEVSTKAESITIVIDRSLADEIRAMQEEVS